MNKQKWDELYMLAAQEVDGNKSPERIAAVRDAIRRRLEDLEYSGDRYSERQNLQATLSKLEVLDAESRQWRFLSLRRRSA